MYLVIEILKVFVSCILSVTFQVQQEMLRSEITEIRDALENLIGRVGDIE